MTPIKQGFVVGIVALALVPACMLSGKTGDTLVDEGGGADKALAGTMAEAQVFGRGETLTEAAGCHTSGYMKFDVPAGEPFQLDVGIESPADTCLSVHYLKASGGAVDGMMLEICSADAPKTIDVEGQEGGAFLQISESGACQGATVSVAVR
jgi:hypothetical protein